ncbi:uncharacterized protein [Diadema setosum]|uniref:uncharacterized protein n=1 Tax=Diadema setosum TaxID=31175 RepID=UPI003B3BA0E7
MKIMMKLPLLVVLALFLCGNSPALGAQTLEAYADTDVSLNFDATLMDGYPFQLLLNERMIFDNDIAVESTLSASQLGRFNLDVRSDGATTSIVLVIASVQEEDRGTYLLRGAASEFALVQESVDVVVFYPPSALRCNVSRSVTCWATTGYPAGEITCFQDDQKLIPVGRNGSSTGQILEAVFTFDPDKAISCCTGNRLFIVPRAECNTFAHFPTTGKPGTQEAPANDTSTKYYVVNATTTPTDSEKEEWIEKYRASLGNACALLVVAVVLYPLALIYHFKIYNRTAKKKTIDTRGEFHEL